MLRKPNQLVGRWRIVETAVWEPDALDLLGPAHITFDKNGTGEFQLIALTGELDYKVVEHNGIQRAAFTWSGFDECDPTSGRGWAELAGDHLRGELFIHLGDDSSFTAAPMPT